MSSTYLYKFQLFILSLTFLYAGAARSQAGFIAGRQMPIIELDNLVQGRLYAPDYRSIKGDQYLSRIWTPGEARILDKTYKDLFLRYDIYGDVLVLWYRADKRIQLNSQYIHYFKLEDRYFINMEHSPYKEMDLKRGFYEVVFEDVVALLAKRKIEIVVEESLPSFFQKDVWFLIKDGQAHSVRNKKDLYLIFGNSHKKPIAKFLKQRLIRVRKADDTQWLQLIKYLNTLPQTN